jgi:acyl-homoserine-lactone acylase
MTRSSQDRHARRGSRKISIHGCANCFQNINSSNGEPAFNAAYGEVVQGSSMVLTTQLTRRGLRAEGILTYSQATDPASPWHANMTRLFSRKRWGPFASRRALRRDPGRRLVGISGSRPPRTLR